MAQVFVDGRVFEVSDMVIDVHCFGLRSFLCGRFRDDVAAKRSYVMERLDRRSNSPAESEALKRVLTELQEAYS